MESTVRKSKIYSYFYGAGTVFQQFLVVAGILFIALAVAASESAYNKSSKLYDKYEVLKSEANVAEDAYEDLYYDYKYELDLVMGEEAIIHENDQFKTQKTAYNEALATYTEAEEKAEEAYQKYEDKRYNSDEAGIPFVLLGILIILTGLGWSIYKKFAFVKKPCEEAYDEELQIKIEEAKEKALDKLNIVAEQIDRVEPVVLNGIANYEPSATPVGKIAGLFQGIIKMFVSLEAFFVFAIMGALYFLFSMITASIGIFFVSVIGAFVLLAILGIKVYKKYEVESYVNPKIIEKLNKVNPTLVFKLGTDDNVRVSLPAITVYMFGDEQIYMYYQYLDIVTGKIFCEGVHEYFYEDIVGVVSAQETKKAYKRGGFLNLMLRPVEYLKESIQVVSSGCKHSESYIVPVGNSLLDTSFVGMRNLIRQKKSGI